LTVNQGQIGELHYQLLRTSFFGVCYYAGQGFTGLTYDDAVDHNGLDQSCCEGVAFLVVIGR